MLKRLKRIFYISLFLTLSASCFLIGSLFFIINNHVIDFSILEQYNSQQPSFLLDDVGNVWGKFHLDRRDAIDLTTLPPYLINAFIAAEDWDFFSHNGLSWRGIIRSIVVNVYQGRKAQGASTITQQLVKLLFCDLKKTFKRKIKEQLYALLLELQYTKQHILQTYLNNVCFGCGIFGIEAASQRFWSKHAHELSLDEAVTLAGIIRSPTYYCPLVYPLSAENRRNVVALKMKNLGFITSQEYDEISAISVKIQGNQGDTCAPHMKEYIRVLLEEQIGKTNVYAGGLSIQTSLNMHMQSVAQDIFKTEMIKLRKKLGDNLEGGMIVIDRKTGEIKALVGGFDFSLSQWNRVTQAQRQLGSIIKPLIYTIALQKNMHFTDTEIDEPFQLIQGNSVWEPHNYNKKFNGQITLAYALSHSNNIVSIKTLLKIGTKEILDLIQQCGIKRTLHSYPSLALGAIDATLWEAVGMFNIFANDGMYVEPHIVRWVKNKIGAKIYKQSFECKRVIESYIAGQVASVLLLAPERIKALYSKYNWIDSPIISKTGTTNDSRTCWFIGSTPTLTTAVYIGFDDNCSMGDNVYPIKTAFPLWLAFNRVVTSSEKEFLFDPSLKKITINKYTGQISLLDDSDAISFLI